MQPYRKRSDSDTNPDDLDECVQVSGFTLHTFSEDFKTLKTEYIGTDGKAMYSFSTTRGDGRAAVRPPSQA